MKTGIYSITHTDSGRVYIGSAKDFAGRWRSHRCLLKKGKHHSSHLQAAWNKYGEPAFEFKKILICSEENLILYEQILLDGHQAADRLHGFNARPVAESVLGMKHSDATRAKIKAARAKQVFSAETKALWSKNRTGRKMPEDFGARARVWKLGNKHTDATKKLIGDLQRGAPHSLASIEGRVKLTLEQVKEILARYKAGGITQAALGEEYSLSPSAVSNIITGRCWGKFLGSASLTS